MGDCAGRTRVTLLGCGTGSCSEASTRNYQNFNPRVSNSTLGRRTWSPVALLRGALIGAI